MSLLAVLSLSPLLIIGCTERNDNDESPADISEPGRISGTVTYLPRIALPTGAVVRIWIEDMSAEGATSIIVDETIAPEGRQVPIPFEIGYDPNEIDAERRYQAHAEIRSRDGILMWVTESPQPVITRGAPTEDVEIRVRQSAGDEAALESPAG